MDILRNYLHELKTRYYQAFTNCCVPIVMERPIISLTFDDVPVSALVNGVPILNRYNYKSTFYVATGLSDIENHSHNPTERIYLNPVDILELHNNGHDIACHTYSHYSLLSGTPEELEQDAIINTKRLSSILQSLPVEHFSYPYGQVSFKAKKLLSRHYKTMRSSRPGINTNTSDLYLLRAESIYNPTFSKKHIQQLIKSTERDGGWLIFYTHGVTGDPDAYSCTPEQFEWVTNQCRNSSAWILPISDAYQHVISACSLP